MPDTIMWGEGVGYLVFLVISIALMFNKNHREAGQLMFLVWFVVVVVVLLLSGELKR